MTHTKDRKGSNHLPWCEAIGRCSARVIGVVILVLFASQPGCSRNSDSKPTSTGKAVGHNLLLITLDTTRADRIGCYGCADAETPTLDRLAANGVLFEKAFAPAPLTLAAHASILTGRYPREHGIRDNGRNALSKKFPTLATIFKEHGYATGAFVASFVLDHRYGLGQGFDAYSDDMGQVSFDTQPLDWQLPGPTVTERALTWLNSVKGSPFFAWVHYYDAHDPHTAPDGFAKEGRKPYDSEIACLDAQVKRLTDWLSKNGLTERTLVVVVGDHGESFNEHGEAGHTTFLFDTNLHVPLLFYAPGLVASGKKVPAVVGETDIFPTILQLFGWDAPSGLVSRSLAPALEGPSIADEDIYSESLYALLAFNWAEQRSLITRDWKYISSTKPQLYDRRNDPDEKTDVLAENPVVGKRLAGTLRKKFDAMIPGRAEVVAMDDNVRRAMTSLGYASGGGSVQSEQFCTQGLPDPRDMIEVVTQFKASLAGLDEAKTPDEIREVLPLIEQVVKQSPGSAYFQQTLGHAYLRANDAQRAFEHLKKALENDPFNAPVITEAAMALLTLGRFDEAEEHFKKSFEIQDFNAGAHLQYGDLLMRQNRLQEAESQLRRAIEIFPNLASAHMQLGEVLRRRGKIEEAIKSYEVARRLKPDLVGAYLGLGAIYGESKRDDEAIVIFREAVRVRPDSGEAGWNLSKALLSKGELADAGVALGNLARIKGFEAEASYGLGVLASKRGDMAETVRLFEQAIRQRPTFVQAIQELGQFYIDQGRASEAIRILSAGLEHSPKYARFAQMLARVYASASDPAMRNGPKAVTLAEEAAKATNYQDPFVLQTLAEALAESGEFEKAVDIAEKAIEIAEQRHLDPLVKSLRDQLVEFRAGRPFHDPLLKR